MISNEYPIAYAEVMTILQYLPSEDVEKIPYEKREFYYNNMDKNYVYEIDNTKDFEHQEMTDLTRAILANLFEDYWATPEEKQAIRKKDQEEFDKIEAEKRAKYNPDNIFKKPAQAEKEVTPEENILPLNIEKQSIFKKIINFISNLFNFKKSI